MKMKIYPNGRKRRLLRKGTPNCRVIFSEVRKDGREWSLHVTKGWRSRKIA